MDTMISKMVFGMKRNRWQNKKCEQENTGLNEISAFFSVNRK